MAETQQPIYQNASLYVGDLDPDTTEAQLFEKFSTCGQILLTKICRDKITRQSLGYAYVNFSQPADAERALDTLNFENLNGKPMRIMWSNRDPALRRSGVGNVFIKNLDKSIDNKSLYDTFSTFGNIISCKIMGDDVGSKGYGFVHFETQEAAERAIKSVNNMLLNGKIVFVGHFLSKQNRATASDSMNKKFTNVFVKNFGEALDDEALRDLFGKFGDITSVKVGKSPDGKPAGFGFVNFKETDDAYRAVQEMNDFIINERKLYVSRFQKRNERSADLKRKYEEKKMERLKKYQGVNLFIKNLDDKIDDEKLKKEFAAFGNITSAKVMSENGRSKGFGFVCFNAPEEATKAVAEMNGRIVGTKPLYVALAQRKEERRKILTAQFRERMSNNQFLYNSPNTNMYYTLQNASANLNASSTLPARFITPSTALAYSNFTTGANMRAQPRWTSNYQQRTAPIQNLNENLYQNQANYFQQQQQQSYSSNVDSMSVQQQRGAAAAAAAASNAAAAAAAGLRPAGAAQMNPTFLRGPYNPQQKPMNQMYGANSSMVNNSRFVNQAFGGYPQQMNPANQQKVNRIKPNQPTGQAINVPGQEPLTIAELSAAQPQMQKQMLGERLYPLVYNLHQEYAGKITGMLLEIDNAELLHMLDSAESLKAKVEEALAVLQSHHEKIQQQQVQKQDFFF